MISLYASLTAHLVILSLYLGSAHSPYALCAVRPRMPLFRISDCVALGIIGASFAPFCAVRSLGSVVPVSLFDDPPVLVPFVTLVHLLLARYALCSPEALVSRCDLGPLIPGTS